MADSPRKQNGYAPSCFLAQHLSSDAPLFLGLELRVIRTDNVHQIINVFFTWREGAC
jgi:hypothetical protein